MINGNSTAAPWRGAKTSRPNLRLEIFRSIEESLSPQVFGNSEDYPNAAEFRNRQLLIQES